MAPSQLVWQLVKGHNAFLRKGLNGTILSAEPGNLYNKQSYKYSGLANAKAVGISAEGDALALTKLSAKNASKPLKAVNTTLLKKNARRALKAVGAEVASYRPDLKNPALARASAVLKSQRVKAAAAKGA